jgi:hypothetical protein
MRRWLWVCVIAVVTGCGGSSSPSSPTTSNVSGTWTGTETVTATTGGPQCLAEVQPIINVQDSLTAAIAENSGNLAATITSNRTGQVCTYSGTAGVNSMTLTGGTCTPNLVQLTCSGNARDIYLSSRTFTGAVNGSTIAGTTVEQWDVFAHGDKSTNLGAIRTSGNFTFQK